MTDRTSSRLARLAIAGALAGASPAHDIAVLRIGVGFKRLTVVRDGDEREVDVTLQPGARG